MIRTLLHRTFPMLRRTIPLVLAATLAAGTLAGGAAVADDDHDDRHHRRERDRERDSDHERARAARQAGDIMPLQRILEVVNAQFDGVLLEVELEFEDDDDDGKQPGWQYEVKMRTAPGAVIKLYYDARTGALIGTRGRGVDAARRPLPR